TGRFIQSPESFLKDEYERQKKLFETTNPPEKKQFTEPSNIDLPTPIQKETSGINQLTRQRRLDLIEQAREEGNPRLRLVYREKPVQLTLPFDQRSESFIGPTSQVRPGKFNQLPPLGSR